jgi:N-acetylglucosaminyl-diphospho-decaprenol L-rhamnosyltransferase
LLTRLNDPELEIVIVSHGAEQLLRSCLQSLLLHPSRRRTHVTVVDSGSRDGAPDMVQREFPEVHLIRRSNIGFSAANNVVLNGAVAPFVLLLNPDTEVHHGTLDSSIDRMESDPSIGMVGCRLVTESGELDHACKRSFPTPVGALAHFTGIGLKPGASNQLSQYRATNLGEHEAGEVDAVNGAYMLVRREALQQVGALDEGYWLYMEDLDWCRRFWSAGWAVFYEPSGTALHVKGGSSGKRRGVKQEIAFHRGMGRFYRRFDASPKPKLTNLFVYAGIAAKLATSLLLTLAQLLVGVSRR